MLGKKMQLMNCRRSSSSKLFAVFIITVLAPHCTVCAVEYRTRVSSQDLSLNGHEDNASRDLQGEVRAHNDSEKLSSVPREILFMQQAQEKGGVSGEKADSYLSTVTPVSSGKPSGKEYLQFDEPDEEYKRQGIRMVERMIMNAKNMPASRLRQILRRRNSNETRASLKNRLAEDKNESNHTTGSSKVVAIVKYVFSNAFLLGFFVALDIALLTSLIALMVAVFKKDLLTPSRSSSTTFESTSVAPKCVSDSEDDSAKSFVEDKSGKEINGKTAKAITKDSETSTAPCKESEDDKVKILWQTTTRIHLKNNCSEPAMNLKKLVVQNAAQNNAVYAEDNKKALKERTITTGNPHIDQMLMSQRNNCVSGREGNKFLDEKK